MSRLKCPYDVIVLSFQYFVILQSFWHREYTTWSCPEAPKELAETLVDIGHCSTTVFITRVARVDFYLVQGHFGMSINLKKETSNPKIAIHALDTGSSFSISIFISPFSNDISLTEIRRCSIIADLFPQNRRIFSMFSGDIFLCFVFAFCCKYR